MRAAHCNTGNLHVNEHKQEKRFWREICVKNYELLELEVVLLQQGDVITASADDNVGGIPDGWGENE